jgi:hypothetical protein
MEEKTQPVKEHYPPSPKKPYSPPIFVDYGKVKDLTSGGLGSKKENKPHDTGNPNPRP